MAYTFTNLLQRTLKFMGAYGSGSSYYTGTPELTLAQEYVASGYNMLMNAYPWWFLTVHDSLKPQATYSTGTVTVSSNTCTIAGGGSWPSWVDDNGILYIDGVYYPITTDSLSSDEITVTGDNVTTATAFELKYSCELPSDFKHLKGQGFYYGSDASRVTTRSTSISHIDEMMSMNDYSEYPIYHAITAGLYNTFSVKFYPRPTADIDIYFDYVKNDAWTSSTDGATIISGGDIMNEVALAACLAVAELEGDGVLGVMNQKYQMLLKQAIGIDRKNNPKTLGNYGDYSYRYLQGVKTAPVRINDVTYDTDS